MHVLQSEWAGFISQNLMQVEALLISRVSKGNLKVVVEIKLYQSIAVYCQVLRNRLEIYKASEAAQHGFYVVVKSDGRNAGFAINDIEALIRNKQKSGETTSVLKIVDATLLPSASKSQKEKRQTLMIPILDFSPRSTRGKSVRATEMIAERIERSVSNEFNCPDLSANAYAFFSRCPPNSYRIADSSLSANSSSPRELNRSYKAAVSTGVGTPFINACFHRPAPFTGIQKRGHWNFDSCGSSISAAAVRSSSHDAITLPRRHTSLTSARSKSYL